MTTRGSYLQSADRGQPGPCPLLHVHGIGDEVLAAFGASSKMNNEWAFLQHLHEIGRQAADRWLTENREPIGVRSTVDLSGLLPPKDGLLSGQNIIIKQRHLVIPPGLIGPRVWGFSSAQRGPNDPCHDGGNKIANRLPPLRTACR